MKRLTKNSPSGGLMLTDGDRDYPICGYSYGEDGEHAARLLEKAIQKLAEYEETECRGKLIRKPCFIGDSICLKGNGSSIPATVIDFTYYSHCGFCAVVSTSENGRQIIPFSEFGITAFLSEGINK